MFSFRADEEPASAKYCCGTVSSTGDPTSGCQGGREPFEVPDARALPGYALLENITSFDASPPELTCIEGGSYHETAVGAGVGVSLGVIALASLAWALWERKRKKVLAGTMTGLKPAGVFEAAADGKTRGMAKLASTRPVAELNG